MSKPVRKSYLRRYKRRFIGCNWREEWAVLHADSTLEWYSYHDESELLGAIVLQTAPDMIAIGPYANHVPGKPELPKDADPNALMVFGTKSKDKTHWFLCSSIEDLNQWMTAISNTLPPPPPPPVAPSATTPTGNPPPYTPTAPPMPPASNPQHQVGYGQRMEGNMAPRRGGEYGGDYGRGQRGGYGGGPNTVIIDRGNNGFGNFASGMMLGTALGWGTGFGWGLGPGLGFGGLGWGRGAGFGVQNTDINITNNYNNNSAGNDTQQDVPAADSDVQNVEPVNEGAVDEGLGQNGLEPDAEMIGDGIDPGLLEDGGNYDMGDGGFDMGGGGFDMGGGGVDMMDFGGGGFDLGGGGFDFGGFDF